MDVANEGLMGCCNGRGRHGGRRGVILCIVLLCVLGVEEHGVNHDDHPAKGQRQREHVWSPSKPTLRWGRCSQ